MLERYIVYGGREPSPNYDCENQRFVMVIKMSLEFGLKQHIKKSSSIKYM